MSNPNSSGAVGAPRTGGALLKGPYPPLEAPTVEKVGGSSCESSQAVDSKGKV